LAHFETFGNYSGKLHGQSKFLPCIVSAVPWLSSSVVRFMRDAVSNCIELSVLKVAWFLNSATAVVPFFAVIGRAQKNWTSRQRDIAFCVILVRLVFLNQFLENNSQKSCDSNSKPILCPLSIFFCASDGFVIGNLLPVSQWQSLSQDVVRCLRPSFQLSKAQHFADVRLFLLLMSVCFRQPRICHC
jgi:hypothetical protein